MQGMPRLPGKPVRARSLNGHAPTALRAHSRIAEPELDWNENMPVIRIAVDEDDPDAGRYAAAVMAATLAMAAEPFPELPAQGKWSKPEWSKPEKTLPDNKHQLTRKQHVFPVRSIERFVDQSGGVAVFDMLRVKERPARPEDILFCARRAWGCGANSVGWREIALASDSSSS
jgi:hypothetical protein